MNISRTLLIILFLFAGLVRSNAQTKPADSVVIRVGESSKVIFAIHDKADLETLKHYDFQALMNDMIVKLEQKDTTQLKKPSQEYLKDSVNTTQPEVALTTPADSTEDWVSYSNHKHHHDRRTYHSMNFDIGTNNYVSNGKFPDQTNELYTVKPIGSWYVGINSTQRTHVTGKFFLEWALGVSWYNFKFQNDKVQITKDNTGITFAEDSRDFDFYKSKLTATYLNASLVPVIDFGMRGKKPGFFEGYHSQSFRFGLGPYVGYRLDAYTKQAYKSDGEKHKEHEHDNFYLNNIRYGMRLQLGFRDVDLFVNYDLNNLFVADKGPKLNAFSFGLTF